MASQSQQSFSSEVQLILDDLCPPKLVLNPIDRFKQLGQRTKSVDIEDTIPIRYYYRSSKQLLRMANTYLDEMNLERAYLLYMRYITLFLEKLPHHPEYKTLDAAEKKATTVKKMLDLVEEIKAKIIKQYQIEFDDYLAKKKTYDEKLDQANKLLADQREKDRADKKNRLQEDYLINLQRQIDQKKRELEERNDSTSKIPSDASNNEITEQKLSELPSPEKTVAVEKKTKPPIIDRSTKPSISIMDDTDQDDIRKLLIPFKKTSDLFKEISQTNTEKHRNLWYTMRSFEKRSPQSFSYCSAETIRNFGFMPVD
ncbi:hypothetical protein SSS_09159 [Sarcoptes scabiei]|nr:hypothetical protein SSS_09159 [Sarcoptes scabiei]